MSEISTTQLEEEEVHPVIKGTDDFSDRLSPMLVKELRQGLKGYGFMLLFISMQAVLALYIFGAAFADSYDDTGHQISTVVFYLLCMVTLIAQPLRGMSAVSSEIKENTIELMVMTRLSAWRIVFGKWISIVSQSALIIIAVAPYLIVRYFFGGMQLFPEIMVLVSIFILSASFTAITVGLSAMPSFIIRGIVSAAIAITVYLACSNIFDTRSDYQDLLDICGFATMMDTAAYFSILFSVIYLSWLALDFGASYIAPAAENRATPRRLIALAQILTIAGVFLLMPARMMDILPVIIGLLAIPICIISLTEPAFLVPNISAAFLSRGFLARKTRYLLYPGWQSGIWYALVLFLITVGSVLFLPEHEHMSYITIITITFSWLLFPLAFTKLFISKRQNLFGCYVAVLLASAVLCIIVTTVIAITNAKGLAIYLCWLPPMQYYLSSSTFTRSSGYSYEFVLGIAIVSMSINWIICFIRSLPEWTSVMKNEQVAETMLANISPPE